MAVFRSGATLAHSAGLIGMWGAEGVGRVGVEVDYTRPPALEVNPTATSRSHVIVGAACRATGSDASSFLNAKTSPMSARRGGDHGAAVTERRRRWTWTVGAA